MDFIIADCINSVKFILQSIPKWRYFPVALNAAFLDNRNSAGCAHRNLTPLFMRAAVLAMSGTRRMYHYGSVQVLAMRLAKDALPAILVAPIICDLLS